MKLISGPSHLSQLQARLITDRLDVYSVSQKIPLRFSDNFIGIFSPNFTSLLHVPIYARLQFFIQLSATLTTLCHIKRDYTQFTSYAKCPPSTETHGWSHLMWHILI